MQSKRVEFRTRCVLAVVFILVLLFLYYLITESGIVVGANEEIDDKIRSLKQTEEAKQTTEGSIVDREGDLITCAQEAGTPAVCIWPEAYSAIVGYHSPIYGTSGLRKRYEENLLLGGKDKTGATICLTTDSRLQCFCYELLGGNIGSIVVLENASSEILSMVSRSDEDISYNVNEIDENYEKYSAIPEFFYNRAVLAQDPPGSTWKMVTSAAIIEDGMENYTYEDTGEYHGIRNAGNAAYGTTDLTKALVKSVNTYFASAGSLLGGGKLKETASNFLVGEEIPLDFTVLTSSFDLEYYQNPLVEQTAFGQGKTQISPLQIAMILQTIVNDGNMQKPYLIQEIRDDGKVLQEGETEILGSPISKETSGKLKEALHCVAENYGYEEDVYGTVYAKTGTAEIEAKNYNHIYLVFADENYTGIISMDRSNQTSRSLVEISKQILDYLKKNIQ